MTYKVRVGKLASKEIKKLPKLEIPKVLNRIRGLAENPFPDGHKKLKASDDTLYRIRQGNYRIIYAVEKEIRIVEVRKVSHRKDAHQK